MMLNREWDFFTPSFSKRGVNNLWINSQSSSVITSLLFLWTCGRTAVSSSSRAMRRETADNGRVRKTLRLPSDRINAWRRFFSSKGPSTKARTRGAGS